MQDGTPGAVLMCIVSGRVWRFALRQNFEIQTEPGSDPASCAKEVQKAGGNCDHHCDRQRVRESIWQVRHVVKIHDKRHVLKPLSCGGFPKLLDHSVHFGTICEQTLYEQTLLLHKNDNLCNQ